MSNSIHALRPFHEAIGRLVDGTATADDRVMAAAYIAAFGMLDDGGACASLVERLRDEIIEAVSEARGCSEDLAADIVVDFEERHERAENIRWRLTRERLAREAARCSKCQGEGSFRHLGTHQTVPCDRCSGTGKRTLPLIDGSKPATDDVVIGRVGPVGGEA